MCIHRRIFDKAVAVANDTLIKDVRIGLGYTIVELEDGRCGISYSFTKELGSKNCTALESAGALHTFKARKLLEGIFSYNLLDATLAIATAQALLHDPSRDDGIDLLDLIEPNSRVVMIGYFAPLVPVIRKKSTRFVICERSGKDGTYPDYAAYFELQQCDVALISATTLINKTIDVLLDRTRARRVALLGPSCVMDPEIFASTPVTHLCGSYITDAELAKMIISQGGGTQKLKVATRKGCIQCRS